MKKHKTVTEYLSKHTQWQPELTLLRDIISNSPLEETVKWGAPVYTYQGKNIVGMGAFKNYVGLWFFQGVFLKDIHNKLVNAQEGKTKALRQWRFDSKAHVLSDKKLITTYILEAIENQKQGKVVKSNRDLSFEIPVILADILKENSLLNKAFNDLTPGRKKEYANYIAEAKREATKLVRLEKCIPIILSGKGLYDRYKNC